MKLIIKRFVLGLISILPLLFGVVSCSNNDNFVQQGTTDTFTQSFNPPVLDVLWVIDNRSDLFKMNAQLVTETQNFFTRLDGTTTSYRMAFATADMEVNPDQLAPIGSPTILEKGEGSVSDRAAVFGGIISQVVNLKTGATNQGLYSAYTILTTKFIPRDNVPLVIVFISDADDHSTDVPSSQDAVAFFTPMFQSLKPSSSPNQLRIYSINYEPLSPGSSPTPTTRCATEYNADIDKPGFQNDYFRLAEAFSSDLVNPALATGDLCQDFSPNIDITGLQQKVLPKTFTLSQTPQASSIGVSVTNASTGATYDDNWTYDAVNNAIDFDTPPPEGSTIVVTYHT